MMSTGRDPLSRADRWRALCRVFFFPKVVTSLYARRAQD
jgi:hypothetical protein